MKARFLFLAAAALAAPAFAQDEGQCILAGRLSDGLWAPKFATVHLFGERGRPIATPTRAALSGVRNAVLDQPALLSRCDGDQPLANADNDPPVPPVPPADGPALSPGTVEVEAVHFPPLRTGGVLVELRVRVPAERVVMLRR
jgi:hypothetical protein